MLEALACPEDTEVPFYNDHMQVANHTAWTTRRLWSSSSACDTAAHIRGTRSSGAYARSCVLSLWLLALAAHANSGSAQTLTSPLGADTGPVLLYSPASYLERSEMEMLERAKISIDVAMYSFTDRELAEELGRLARSGVRVRVYRDSIQYQQESQHGLSTIEILLGRRET